MQTNVKYGILLPPIAGFTNGSLARVESYANSGDCCGEYTYKLTDDKDCPEWLVDDPNDVAKTLFSDVQWYNSDQKRPCWGKFKKADLRPAKVVMTVEICPADIKIPINLESLEVRDLPWALAKSYAQMPDLPKDKRYVFILTKCSQDEMKQHVGNVICFDDNINNPRRLVAVQPVPVDYIDPDKEIGHWGKRGKPSSMLICEALT